MTIDNGNHLVLSGNHAVLDFAEAIGSAAAWSDRQRRSFRSSILPPASAGRCGSTTACRGGFSTSSRRVPGTRARRLSAAGAAAAGRRPTRRSATSIDCSGPLYRAAGASAAAGGAQHRAARGLGGAGVGGGARDAGAGGQACRPLIARDGLGPTFIEPALKHLRERNVEVRLDHELRALRFAGGRIAALDFGAETVDARRRRCGHPGGAEPCRGGARSRTCRCRRAIAPSSMRISASTSPPGVPPMIGVINGTTEWIFAFAGRLSVTISDADRLMDVPRAMLAQTIWQEVSRADGNCRANCRRGRSCASGARPSRRRPRRTPSVPARATHWDNLVLAGDWTATGLPATLGERGALRQSRRRGRHERRRVHDRGPARASIAASRRRRGRCSTARSPTATGASSSRPTATIPGRIRAAAALSRRAGRCRAGAQDRRLSAPHARRSMAAGRCSTTATST